MAEEVILGPNGSTRAQTKVLIVADASTVSPARAGTSMRHWPGRVSIFSTRPAPAPRRAHQRHPDLYDRRQEGGLRDKLRPYFEAMGKKLYYCGGPGMGLHAKLSQNLILSNLLQAFNEGMVLALKAGVDPELMLDILDNSAAKSG